MTTAAKMVPSPEMSVKGKKWPEPARSTLSRLREAYGPVPGWAGGITYQDRNFLEGFSLSGKLMER